MGWGALIRNNEWHLFVLGGSVCHFVVMFLFVVPSP
jgi:predicted membrane channel-forming protein YqfA (hemolysin III family)